MRYSQLKTIGPVQGSQVTDAIVRLLQEGFDEIEKVALHEVTHETEFGATERRVIYDVIGKKLATTDHPGGAALAS